VTAEVGRDLLRLGTVVRCFQSAVRRWPERPVVAESERVVTFRQLAARARMIAGCVRDEGGDPERPVLLFFEPGIQLVAAMLGVLEAGRFFLCLDPAVPEGRNRLISADAGGEIGLTSRRMRDQAQPWVGGLRRLVEIDELDGRPAEDMPADEGGSPNRPAALTYTSGSTGRPKGVIQTDATILHNVAISQAALGLGPEDRSAMLYPPSVNPALRDTFTAVLSGALLCPYPVASRGVEDMGGWIREQEITVLCCGVTLFREFVRTLGRAEVFPDIRIVKLGGEPVTFREIDLFRRHFLADARLYYGLGTTETGTVTANFIDPGTTPGPGVSLGFAAPDTGILLVDETGEPVPSGEVGEIVVESAFLSPGYWRSPELTARVFSTSLRGAGLRRYRTGDLGRLGPDGALEHLGRADFQRKVRGVRIEVAEVEATLLSAPGVADAAVALRPGLEAEEELTAYLVTDGGERVDWSAIRRSLYRRLPQAMVPSRAVLVGKLPRTVNGKLDRGRLDELRGREVRAARNLTYPRDPIETRLAKLWCEVLEHEIVGIDESFFDIGGDSLKAVELFVAIEDRFSVALPLASIFEAPTIKAQAALLRDGLSAAGGSPVVTLANTGEERPLFCIPAEDGYAFVYRPMARLLGDRRAVHVLQYPGLDGRTKPLETVEELAVEMIGRMRAVQPEGPYLILGHSFGGVVAYEMTRRLQKLGQRVALLVLVDTHVPRSVPRRARLLRDAEVASLSVGRVWRECLAPGQAGPARRAMKTGGVLVHMAWRGYRRRLRNTAVEHTIHEVRRVAAAARKRYRFRAPLTMENGRVALFRASPGPEVPHRWCRLLDPVNGWAPHFVGDLEAYQVPGDHVAVLAEPNVRRLAALVDGMLG